ncbi:hypothetical protein JOD02_001729 [Caldicoprobacter guelmensis]|uniref:hypothetical protein n=1 Tax=Caldicoprobacter guelmensis TaxID=1170224 RepID=UPI00195D9857|nr:hypothetical protein [Caldicoprobacter guelmensis]MBM7582860.1 hypothetical protein [Caldicoprobacter guelmensis]
MSKGKEELLICAEHAADYIIKSGSTGFVSFILDMINLVREGDKPEGEKLQHFYKMLYDVRNSNLEMLGGGRSLKEAYSSFIDGFLKISKKSSSKYEMNNGEFGELNLNELYYVFGWVRRLVKAQEPKVRNNREHDVGPSMGHKGSVGGARQQRESEGSSADVLRPSGRHGRGSRDARTTQPNTQHGRDTQGDSGMFNTQMQEQLKKLKREMK